MNNEIFNLNLHKKKSCAGCFYDKSDEGKGCTMSSGLRDTIHGKCTGYTSKTEFDIFVDVENQLADCCKTCRNIEPVANRINQVNSPVDRIYIIVRCVHDSVCHKIFLEEAKKDNET